MNSTQRIEEIKEVRRLTGCSLWESLASHDEAQTVEGAVALLSRPGWLEDARRKGVERGELMRPSRCQSTTIDRTTDKSTCCNLPEGHEGRHNDGCLTWGPDPVGELYRVDTPGVGNGYIFMRPVATEPIHGAPAASTPDSATGHDAQPARYTRPDGRETLDAIRDSMDDAAFLGFCIGNAIKYEDRTGKKGDAEEDRKKAAFYRDMAAHIEGRGRDPRAGRPGFVPYRRPVGSP